MKRDEGRKNANECREGQNVRYMGNGNSCIVSVGGTQFKVSWDLKVK